MLKGLSLEKSEQRAYIDTKGRRVPSRRALLHGLHNASEE